MASEVVKKYKDRIFQDEKKVEGAAKAEAIETAELEFANAKLQATKAINAANRELDAAKDSRKVNVETLVILTRKQAQLVADAAMIETLRAELF